MTRNIVYIGGPVVFMLAITLLVLFKGESPTVLFERVLAPSEARAKAARLRLHPLTSERARQEVEKVHAKTWEEWVDIRVETILGHLVEIDQDTPEKIEARRAELQEKWTETSETFKLIADTPLPFGERYPVEKLPGAKPVIIPSKPHEGPQTTEALMASFDAEYLESHPQALDWEAQYPRAAFLQMILDRGIPIENRDDYKLYMNIRGWLFEAESRPEWWAQGLGGVEPTDNFEAFKTRFIDRKIWINQTYKRVVGSDPEIHGVVFFDERPEAYLPMRRKVLYVHRDGPATKMWGTLLDEPQKDDLIYRGIHPEGIEIIYVDDDYNVLSEKPAPYDPEEDGVVRSVHPPMTLKAYKEMIKNQISGTDIETGEHFVGDSEGFGSDTFDAERAKRAQAAAESEFEAVLREFEKFSNMTDAQIETELKKQVTSQLPEVPTDESLETELREQINPQRFSEAMATLRRYGREEGLRRLTEKDPTLAEQIERFLEGQRQ